MSSRILLDDVERGPGQDNHPSAPAAPDTPRPTEPVEPRETAPPAESGEPTEPGAEPDFAQREKEYKERIDALTRQRYEAHRERDQIRADWQRFQQQQQTPVTPEQQAEQRGYQRARQEDLGRTFDQACNDLYLRGRQEYGAEMDDAVSALRAVGWADRHDALAAITRLPNGHRVYRELARDLDRASRILQMAPMDMAMELTRMGYDGTGRPPVNSSGNESQTEPVRQVEVSRAPEPVRHIGGRSTQSERPLDHKDVSMAEFIRRRDREERRSRIAR